MLLGYYLLLPDVWHHIWLYLCVCADQLGVKALTVEDLLQAQKEISAHNRQLKEQTKQLERDMALLRDHSLLLVRLQCCVVVTPLYYYAGVGWGWLWFAAVTIHGALHLCKTTQQMTACMYYYKVLNSQIIKKVNFVTVVLTNVWSYSYCSLVIMQYCQYYLWYHPLGENGVFTRLW